jgi:hypothetical protein
LTFRLPVWSKPEEVALTAPERHNPSFPAANQNPKCSSEIYLTLAPTVTPRIAMPLNRQHPRKLCPGDSTKASNDLMPSATRAEPPTVSCTEKRSDRAAPHQPPKRPHHIPRQRLNVGAKDPGESHNPSAGHGGENWSENLHREHPPVPEAGPAAQTRDDDSSARK